MLLQFPVGQLRLQEWRQAAEDQGVKGGRPGAHRAMSGPLSPPKAIQTHQALPAQHPQGTTRGSPSLGQRPVPCEPVPPPQWLQLPYRPWGLSRAGVWGALRPLSPPPLWPPTSLQRKTSGSQGAGRGVSGIPELPGRAAEGGQRVVTCPGTTTVLRGAGGGNPHPNLDFFRANLKGAKLISGLNIQMGIRAS